MSLIAMINLRVDAQCAESADTADTEKKLLLESVLPVAAIEVICHLTVFFNVRFIVSIKEIEVSSADCHFPDAGRDGPSRECHASGNPVAVLVHYRTCRNLGEVLCVIFSHLVTLCGKHLCEIAVTVKQTHSHKVNVHVTCLFQVVTGKNTETARIDAERRIQTVFHTEISDGRVFSLGLKCHIIIEFLHDALVLAHECRILAESLESLQADSIEHSHRVVARFMPDDRVNGLEQCFGTFVPTPPEVLGKYLKSVQCIRQMPGNHYTLP